MSGSTEVPWVDLKAVCHLYGLSYKSALNAAMYDKLPVKTYKVGKKVVIDKAVHEEFFRRQREEGLRALDTTKS